MIVRADDLDRQLPESPKAYSVSPSTISVLSE